MLTLDEIAMCVMVLFGSIFEAYWMAQHFNDKRWFPAYVSFYGFLVVLPKLVIVLYAFTKMLND